MSKLSDIATATEEANEAADLRHKLAYTRISKTKKELKIIIIACSFCILFTYLATSYILFTYGSMILWNGDSIASLRAKLDANTKKRNELKETLLVFEALAFNDVVPLKQSETRNQLREKGGIYGDPHKFTFNEWSRVWQTKILERAIETEATNILTHITLQDDWDLKISDELAANVYTAMMPNPNNVAKLVAENNLLKKEIQAERRKKRVLLAEKFDRPCYLDGSRTHQNGRKVHTSKIKAETTLNTLRGFKSDKETLRRDGKFKLLHYVTTKP